jgi:hypothetical protein
MLSVIPGAASTGTLQALVITDAASHVAPQITARAADGSTPTAAWNEITVSAKLAAELSQRKLRVHRLLLSNVPSDSRVDLSVTLGADTEQLKLTTLPTRIPPEGLSFIAATCYYDGFHYGAKLRAALSMPYLGLRSAFQLWAGDNLYMDVPVFRNSTTPHGDTLQRYLDYFTRSEYRRARALHTNFTTYDDHEFWNNFPESQIWLGRSSGSDRADYIDAGQGCVKLFQSSVNPSPVADGLSYRFDLAPVSFFVADMRTYRTKHDAATPRMMTKLDLAALIDWARTLQGPGVLVLGQPLWIEAGGYGDYNTPFFTLENQAIWKALREAPYDILVVTGDVHHSRVLKLSFADSPNRNVYEFCTSPASHIPTISSTFGLGHSQDHGTVTPPTQVAGSGQKVKAQFLFGTRAPNSFGIVRLDPLAGGEVRVGGGFIDYTDTPRYAYAETAPGIPPLSHTYQVCQEPRMFTLRMR